jgi:hypothetical protein
MGPGDTGIGYPGIILSDPVALYCWLKPNGN